MESSAVFPAIRRGRGSYSRAKGLVARLDREQAARKVGADVRRLRTPDTMEGSWPELDSSRRDFLPLLGEREGVRADVSVHLTSTSGPPPRRGIRSPEALESRAISYQRGEPRYLGSYRKRRFQRAVKREWRPIPPAAGFSPVR